jgi:adenine deaminase
MKSTVASLKNLICAARGKIPADLVFRGGKIANVFTGEVETADLAVYNGLIAGVGSGYHGSEEIDVSHKTITPGLIDGHLHIESSMMLPSRLAEAIMPHGTTTIIADPHEIANVMGLDGIRLMLKDSRDIPLDIFFMAPSCVPATHLETSGAELKVEDLIQLKTEDRILGLAEMMNFPGVLAGADDVLKKILEYQNRIIDGHAPGLTGHDLQAYIAAGIRSDHEAMNMMEGLEKIRLGMVLMIREGSTAKNLDALLPLVNERNEHRCCFVSDDLHPLEIAGRGHLNHMITRSILKGLNPISAIKMASWNPAQYFGLKDRGALAPGYRADLVILNDLSTFKIDQVYKNGQKIVDQGVFTGEQLKRDVSYPSSMNLAPISADDLKIPYQNRQARIIEIVPGQIMTKASLEKVPQRESLVISDIQSDTLKLVVAERHKKTGNIAVGLVRGFGLKQGALATSVAHDSHNIIAVGVHDQDILRAIQEVAQMGGGMAVVINGELIAAVPLPVAGLMSQESFPNLLSQLEGLKKAIASTECLLPEPFMCLSFLSLPVIPELKLTDKGLVDVNRFEIVPLYLE